MARPRARVVNVLVLLLLLSSSAAITYALKPIEVIDAPPMGDSLYPGGVAGRVAGRVALSTDNAFGIAGAYVAIVNASNISQAYYEGLSDGSGLYQFTEVNSTYNGAFYEDRYRVYANHSLFGESVSDAFGVRDTATTGMDIYIDPLPIHVTLTASRDYVTADSGDHVRVTAYVTDARGYPVIDDTLVCFAVDAADWTAAANGSLGHGDTSDNVREIDDVGTIGGYASVSFGWVDPAYAGNSSRVRASYAGDDSINDWVDIAFDPEPTPTPILPVASFISDVTEGVTPKAVQFTDTSTGYATAWQWDFGDVAFGTANDSAQNPVHMYSTPGSYTVTLTASNSNGSSTKEVADYIVVVAPTVPVADFEANTTDGVAPLCVGFTDASSGYATAWQWDFGDAAFGTANDSAQNPAHVYTTQGTYTVTLTAINANGTGTSQVVGYVAVTAPTVPVADFGSNVTAGVAPCVIAFSDDSAGFIAGWQWDFGDAAFGTANATIQDPVHVYSTPGSYTVTLTASNANGTSTMQKTAYVTIIAPTIPTAGFSANVSSGVAPLCVGFTDASTGYATAWQWDFGDSTGNSTMQNPAHVYAMPGTYTVILTAINANGTNAMQRTGYITVVAPTLPTVSFIANVTSGITPLCVGFTDQSTGYATAWQWDFGDAVFGTANLTARNPVHIYATPGSYTVTLTASNANGSRTMQRVAYIKTIAPTIPTAGFAANVTSGPAPLCVGFTDQSTGYATAWQWDFGDVAFGTANETTRNPVHMYSASGTYTVTLTVSSVNGTSTMQRTGYISATGDAVSFIINLTKDWNLISIPIELEDNNISNIFPADVLSNITDIWGWDETEQNWIYYSCNPDDEFYDLFPKLGPLTTGRTYWVRMIAPGSITLEGTVPEYAPSSPASLVPGWNFVGVTGTMPVLLTTMYPAATDVWGWNELEQNWVYYSINPDDPFYDYYPKLINIIPGDGYWVRME